MTTSQYIPDKSKTLGGERYGLVFQQKVSAPTCADPCGWWMRVRYLPSHDPGPGGVYTWRDLLSNWAEVEHIQCSGGRRSKDFLGFKYSDFNFISAVLSNCTFKINNYSRLSI